MYINIELGNSYKLKYIIELCVKTLALGSMLSL